MRKIWTSEDNCIKLRDNFAHHCLRYCNLCMPYWIRDQEGRLVRIENPQDTELDICVNIMDPPPEDQNSQQGQGGNPNAYLSMRDRMHPPRMSAPSCILPPLEQLVIRPHIVPLLPTFHGMESENPYSHIKEFEENPDEAMDFLSYVAEVSRGWDEPNSREKGKFPSQQTQNPKAGMYMLSEDVDMKAKVATIAGDECPTMPAVREMLGDQVMLWGNLGLTQCTYGNTYNSSWRNHPNFSWKPRPPPYQPQGQTQAPQQPSSVEQAIANLSGKMKNSEKRPLIKEGKNQEEQSGKKSASKSSIEEEPRIVIKEDMMKKHMPPPFPQALHGKKEIKNSSEILEVLRQVKVNIPLLDMIKQVPTYAKFLKDLCTVKRGLQVTKNAFLTEQVSAIIRPTTMTLSLADRSVKIPRGVIEDVLVQVDKFYYPVDFVVLDTDSSVKEENYVPIILGRPFLATSNAIVNCRNGVMQLTFGNMTLEVNIFHLCKRHLYPEEEEGFEEVCLINTLVEEHCDKSLEESLNENLEVLEDGFPEPSDVLAIMSPWRRREEILPLFNQEDSQGVAVEDPPKLILKPLPVELKYAYLEDDENVQWWFPQPSLVIKRIVF
ncbi:hypothetical protein CK203_042757 [Vitis vinifera]|uniref:Uncharacterized protein n=1 Tax=Vitis vinifera TaxID=29760 RepID=A0A438HQK2_VITVI|nr:hypothetical protein CK203_042757 [Vitis vinifera]